MPFVAMALTGKIGAGPPWTSGARARSRASRLRWPSGSLSTPSTSVAPGAHPRYR
jgi:hypothetical protein